MRQGAAGLAFTQMRRIAGHCANCREPHPRSVSNNRKWCAACSVLVRRAQSSRYDAITPERRQRRNRPRGPQETAELSPAFRRMVADATLAGGGVKRHCAACGMWYIMDAFSSPCPSCADHLIDFPQGAPHVDFSPGS